MAQVVGPENTQRLNILPTILTRAKNHPEDQSGGRVEKISPSVL